jgi:hypothetical protein
LRIRRPAREHRTGEQTTPSRDATHHGSDWHADDVGDLVVFEAVDVVQFDGGCEVFGQLRQRGAHFFTRQSRGDFIEQQIRITADQFLVRSFEASDGDELATSRGAFSRLAQHGAENSVQPGTDAGRIAKLVEVRPRAHTRFLNGVLGVRPDIAAPCGKREQTVEVREHQGVESRLSIGETLLGKRGHVSLGVEELR